MWAPRSLVLFRTFLHATHLGVQGGWRQLVTRVLGNSLDPPSVMRWEQSVGCAQLGRMR